MAQAVDTTTLNSTPQKPPNWDLEYDKILRFRDAVLEGRHPRIKLPFGVKGKPNKSPQTQPSPSNNTNQRSTPTAHPAQSSPSDTSRSVASVANVSKPATELDPIFHTKSKVLIDAEISLKRQRIERNLRDQVEQQKIAAKLALQTLDSVPDFDLNEVFERALQIVKSEQGANLDLPARPAVSDSDSFDENTFYSSQHDTPGSRSLASQDHKAPGEAEMLDTVMMVDQPSPLAHNSSAYPPHSPDLVVVSSNPSQKNPEQVNVTGPNLGHSQSRQPKDKPRYNLRGKQPAKSTAGEKFDEPLILEDASSSAKDSTYTSPVNRSNNPSQDSTDSNVAHPMNRRSLNNAVHVSLPDPIHRATHDLSPIAPQAARVSPLLNAKTPAVNQQPFLGHAQAAPVAALQTVSVVSSPEGSKRGMRKRRNERRKDKGRKNSSKQAASPVPYIKPEPRSPSPFEPLSRPLKRQRQSFQNADGLDYDEPRRDRHEELSTVSYNDSLAPQPATQSRGGGYEDEPRSYSPRPIRRERDDVDYRRIASVQHARRPQSPTQFALPYSPTEARHVRAASQAVFERPSREPVRYYREEHIPRREIVDLDRERSRSPVFRERRTPLPMAPPRAVPERVVVDAHGRRYYAPPEERYYPAGPAAPPRYSVAPSARPREVVRYSVAPPPRGPETEVIYERAPMRPPPEVITDDYEERRVVYRRPVSPQFAVPPVRRVIAQTEREGTVDLRAYREREYSTRPTTIAPQDEYIRVRGGVERRQVSHYPETPREYVSRASMHPEPIRYEIPREYVGRLQSVRPEALGREFAPSIRTEPRREILREASVRPGEPGLVRREYAAPPPVDGERYEYARPIRRAAEEPIYIDGPRETGLDTLPDESRGQVYR